MRKRTLAPSVSAGALTSGGVPVALASPLILFVAALGLLVGVVAVRFTLGYGSDAAGFWESAIFVVPFGLTGLLILALVDSSARRARYPFVGSLLVTVATIVAIALPGRQLLTGQRASVLTELGLHSSNAIGDVPHAYYVALLVMLTFVTAECFIELYAPALRLRRSSGGLGRAYESKHLFTVLLLMGAPAVLIAGQGYGRTQLATRGDAQGQGLLAVLIAGIPLAIAVGILRHHWGSRRLAGLSACAFIYFAIGQNSRSPLLFVGVAVLLRLLFRVRTRGLRVSTAIIALLVAYLVTVGIVMVADVRVSIIRQGHANVARSFTQAATNPVGRLASVGALNTLDGLVLSLNVNREALGVQVWDPLKGIVDIVPRQLWPTKPTFLSSDVTQHYLDTGGRSGIFLSGAGYLYVVYGGSVGAVCAAVLGAAGFSLLLRRLPECSLVATLAVYLLVRFTIGGDAFDLLYVLTMYIGLLLARGITFATSGSHSVRKAGQQERIGSRV